MTEPAYFDSQAQAAAALKLDVEVLRQAKRDGCPAFRSGRVYREDLEQWLREKQNSKRLESRARSEDDSATETPSLSFVSWKDRRDVLFEIMEFLHAAHGRGEMTAKEYVSAGDRLMPLLCKIADVFALREDEIDRAGWMLTWRDCRKQALRDG